MSQNYEDTRTYQIGKIGEQIVLELLRSFKKVVRVDDVSDLTQYQVQDVDFVVYMNNHGKQTITTVEVKSEPMAAKTGNFFVEKKMRYTKDNSRYQSGVVRRGWLYTSQAKWFFWYVEDEGKVYACLAKRLRWYIDNYFPKERTCNDGYKIVTGYLVPIHDLCEKCNVYQWNVNTPK